MKTEFELAILRAFGTYKECTRFMKWSPSAISKIVNGQRQLKVSEIEKLEAKFNIQTYEQFKDIFFNLPNGTNN